MAKELTVNVVVVDDQNNPVVLEKGTAVPSEYADQVGDHCFEAPADDVDGDVEPARKTRTRTSE